MARSNTCSAAFLFVLLTGFPSSSMPAASTGCANDLGSPIPNFCVVTPDVLWRGAKPAQDGAAWLIQHRVRTIVNLELLHDDRRAFGVARLASGGRCGFASFWLCVSIPDAARTSGLQD